MTLMLNGMDRGHSGVSTETLYEARSTSEQEVTLAVASLHRFLLQESARLERWRRSSGAIGVRACAQLLKISQLACYGAKAEAAGPRVKMVAADIDEPMHDRTVDMIECLPAPEAEYYADEHNVVVKGRQSETLFQEITEQYAFVASNQKNMSHTS